LSPLALGKRGLKVLTQYVELFADLPKEIRRGLYTAKTGNLKIRVELTELDALQRMVMRAGRLLAVAGITSALLIGTSIFVSLTKKPKQ
jgi:ubiquinone biosynthesis protein